ncbi:hypothetical protein B0H12DRAFT_478477 [Mycena haematopus]|nr:hypothetical protein B0H12DRAFT_478477 [Mycena haematopus]
MSSPSPHTSSNIGASLSCHAQTDISTVSRPPAPAARACLTSPEPQTGACTTRHSTLENPVNNTEFGGSISV